MPSESLKRTVACTNCHKSKVKCIYNQPNEPCLRCLKHNKPCILDPESLKRKKKYDVHLQLESKVDELTKQIEDQKRLIDQLKNETNVNGNGNGTDTKFNDIYEFQPRMLPLSHKKRQPADLGSTSGSIKGEDTSPRTNGFVENTTGVKKSKRRKVQENSDFSWEAVNSLLTKKTEKDLLQELQDFKKANVMQYYQNSSDFAATATRREQLLQTDIMRRTDLVADNTLTETEIRKRLKLYMTELYARFPIVSIFNDSTSGTWDASSVDDAFWETFDYEAFRKTKPYLYMVILSITASTLHKDDEIYTDNREAMIDKDLILKAKAMEMVSYQVMCVGEKSIELLQSLLLLCCWYDSTELFRHRRYHFLNVLCVTMSNDLNISGKVIYYFSQSESAVKNTSNFDASESVETKILALAIYFMSVTYSIFLKRDNMMKWNQYLDNCYQAFVKSTDHNLRTLAIYAKLCNNLEQIFKVMHALDFDPLDVNEPRTRYILSDLQSALYAVKKFIDKGDHQMLAFYYSIEAYLLEPSLHRILTDPSDVSFSELSETNIIFSSHLISIIGKCAESCLNGFNHYLQLPKNVIASLPLVFQSRIFYMTGILLRLRYLTILVPQYSEIDILPSGSFEVLNKFISASASISLEYPLNHFLPKSRLVLILFIETYTSQIKSTLSRRFNINKSNIDSHNFYTKEWNELIAKAKTLLNSSGSIESFLAKNPLTGDNQENLSLDNRMKKSELLANLMRPLTYIDLWRSRKFMRSTESKSHLRHENTYDTELPEQRLSMVSESQNQTPSQQLGQNVLSSQQPPQYEQVRQFGPTRQDLMQQQAQQMQPYQGNEYNDMSPFNGNNSNNNNVNNDNNVPQPYNYMVRTPQNSNISTSGSEQQNYFDYDTLREVFNDTNLSNHTEPILNEFMLDGRQKELEKDQYPMNVQAQDFNSNPVATANNPDSQFSIWALNDNIWNELLMGFDLGKINGN